MNSKPFLLHKNTFWKSQQGAKIAHLNDFNSSNQITRSSNRLREPADSDQDTRAKTHNRKGIGSHKGPQLQHTYITDSLNNTTHGATGRTVKSNLRK
uniref:Uncharacterized protein n=1 Tax=Setaria italica TaxID=4555 RepID=K3YB54_SETIT